MVFASSAATASASDALLIKFFPVLAILLGLGIIAAVAMTQIKRSSENVDVRKDVRLAYGLGGGFLIWGVLALIASFCSELWYVALLFWGVGLLIGWTGGGNIRLIFRCTLPVRAIVEKHNQHSSRGVSTYAPVFSYRYEGKEYHLQARHTFSRRKAMRDFAVGSEVEIFIDPAAPEKCTPIKRVRVGEVLLLLLGAAFIGVGLFVVISGATVSLG